MKIGSLSEYAAHAGVSAPYVTKLKKAGRIVFVEVDGRQRVNFELTDRLVANTADLGRSLNGGNSRGPAARVRAGLPLSDSGATARIEGDRGEPAMPAVPVEREPTAADKTADVFRQAQAKERVFNAMTAELTYRKLTNTLVDKAAAERTVFDAFRALRDHAFQAPQRAAARCVGISDMREIERVFTDELRKAYAGWEQKLSTRFAAKGA